MVSFERGFPRYVLVVLNRCTRACASEFVDRLQSLGANQKLHEPLAADPFERKPPGTVAAHRPDRHGAHVPQRRVDSEPAPSADERGSFRAVVAVKDDRETPPHVPSLHAGFPHVEVPVLTGPNGEDFDRRAVHRLTARVRDLSFERNVVGNEPQNRIRLTGVALCRRGAGPDKFRPIDNEAAARFKPIGGIGGKSESVFCRHQDARPRRGRVEHVGQAAFGPRELEFPVRIAHRIGRRG